MQNVVYLAGIDNSPPDHWQAMWYGQDPRGTWVEHESWDEPVRDTWVADLDKALAAVEGPALLIAHSLGCLVLTEWARDHAHDAIAGALLVAVPDPDGERFPAVAQGFGPPGGGPLPFPTVVVASEDDPYGTVQNSTAVADRLGARLVNVGLRGHINSESRLGEWVEGRRIFREHFSD